MIRTILVSIATGLLAVVAQATWLRYLSFLSVVPDLSLVILVFFAAYNGSMVGQISGFATGFIHDALSATPFGFNSFIRTLVGGLSGLIKGKFRIDKVAIPCITVFLATLVKYATQIALGLVFTIGGDGALTLLAKVWIEAGYNSILAPLVFLLLRLPRKLTVIDVERELV